MNGDDAHRQPQRGRRGHAMKPVLFVLGLLLMVGAARAEAPRHAVVLGVDGLDPVMTRELSERGLLPNIKRVMSSGGFMPLATANPPAESGGVVELHHRHGTRAGMACLIFSPWIARPCCPICLPHASAPATRAPLAVGDWRVPLSVEQPLLLRDGTAFWQVLEEAGVATTLFQIPANYPPVESGGRAISGMGTPDLRGNTRHLHVFHQCR